MKEDLEALQFALRVTLEAAVKVMEVAKRHPEHTNFGEMGAHARATAEQLKVMAEDIADLVAERVRAGSVEV